MINAVELVRKQEEYRNGTIAIVQKLHNEGKPKREIAETVVLLTRKPTSFSRN
ncbi:hypothetical protein [Mesobacillus maritimus]|uniref:Uncharacterized protein n=1 Tax=Mesobacillus maritimus TaxID=1643336 RepID=A0ABS7K8S3_9BACI|nr:hypothetical protein [Mesobacillus maritimus]MBY0098672.1 hypothetical protein [Mesobacillus maritimus]